jgi:hypothetical protein
MVITQLTDHGIHFHVEGFCIQPGLDFLFVAGLDLVPIPPIKVRVYIDILDNICKLRRIAFACEISTVRRRLWCLR